MDIGENGVTSRLSSDGRTVSERVAAYGTIPQQSDMLMFFGSHHDIRDLDSKETLLDAITDILTDHVAGVINRSLIWDPDLS